MKNQKVIDLILGAIIVVSLGFIAVKVFWSPAREIKIVKSKPTDPAPVPSSRVVDSREPRKIFNQYFHRFLQALPSPSDATWSAVTNSAGIKPFVVQKTSACDSNPEVNSNAIYVVAPKLFDDYMDTPGKLFIDVGSKRCFKTGESVYIGLYSNVPTVPYVSTEGKIEIRALLSVPYNKLDAATLNQLKIDKATFDRIVLRPGRRADYPVTFVRFGEYLKSPPPSDRPLPAFLRYSVISAAKIKALKQSGMAVKIVDVRSAAEAKSKLPGVVNIPYPKADHTFKWSTLNGDLIESESILSTVAKFHSDIAKGPKTAVVVVGDGPTDGRPLWILGDFLDEDMEDVYWFYDGMKALEAAI